MQMTAFLFPGQGSQFAGMGKSLAESWREARAVFEEADDVLGFSLSRLCFEGPEDQLRLTENTQPALLACSVAAFRVLESQGETPSYVAGHSLGEYSALVAAGALSFSDAVRLVRNRGQFMQDAVAPGVGAMAALLKLPEGKLDSILTEAAQGEIVTPANFNSPDQVVIAGHTGAVTRASELAKSAGAKRAVMLAVSAPFHCPLMKPAQDRMQPLLEATPISDTSVPVVNNWQARESRSGSDLRTGLYEQIPNAVRWTQSMQHLIRAGVNDFREVGPGSVLTGLLRTIDSSVRCKRFGEAADLQKVHTAS